MSRLQFSFQSSHRLLSAEFKPVFENGERYYSRHFLFLFYRAADSQQNKIGIISSKKKLPTSVERHRVRRLIKESFRLEQHCLTGYHIVVIVNRSAFKAPQEELWQCLNRFWQFAKNKLATS